MRKRSISFLLRLSESEHARLTREVEKTGLSREAYIRALINGYVPKQLPPLDYYAMIRELHAIGNNLNQLAVKAHTTGRLERAAFQEEADHLRRAVQHIQQAVTEPERRSELPSMHTSGHPP
ncbi:MobC family plasmid mobilization relaxosome protein [Paenibacillus validus]|uniref:MobC family plasmid mobilization relaxosome protein n=1 Tax=Paenibacillus TaxID=44249 RepID=UPI000FD9B2A8|nr:MULTISPECIES: MobC family plasmid mobilization relaxosome protein [Paenibacillus]MED4599738.1 MobC family plasmid mobilization relaxosome protein [Paenibacillus validus]MED4604829.1 MobC family plasmid mobilization relaxosome protein [Paenibacillus validus]NTZ19105.1 plasmid mobilization relaxosome protein MobC [Paenibacillus sp. JMULE4]